MFHPGYLNRATGHKDPFKFPFQCIFLKIFGSWPVRTEQDDGWNPRQEQMARLYKFYSAVVIFLIFITCCAQSFFVFSKWGEILIVTECGCTVFMGIHNLLRCLHLSSKRQSMKRLMEEFLEAVFVPKEESVKIHSACEKRGNIMRMMSLLQFSLICIYVILPLFDLFFDSSLPSAEEAAALTKGSSFLYETVQPFPYPMLFPYNANYGLSYFLTFVYTSFSGFAVVTTLFSEDSLFCCFLTYACGRLELLHHEIRDLKRHKDLRQPLRLHNQIIDFCHKLETFFSPILLVNFMISSFLICLVGFQLATAKLSLLNFVKFFVYIVSTLAQLLVLCWHGDKLIEMSLYTRVEIYNCNWEDDHYPLALKKGLVLMLARAQKPLRITALKFSFLSLESFTKILSTSASYFALLRTMIEDN